MQPKELVGKERGQLGTPVSVRSQKSVDLVGLIRINGSRGGWVLRH